jgi:peptide/nickel transport system ATP-binding protein
MGTDLTALRSRELKRLRPRFQMIFQDAVGALNPRRCVGDAVAAPLAAMRDGTAKERKRRAAAMMERVGIPGRHYRRKPWEFSGGQCQRIQIARALISRPDLLVCDEPVSSLDVSVQAQILNLLEDMRREYGLTLLFISHDLAVVKNVSDRVAVMYLGRLCEVAPSEALYRHPRHPYTRALLDAVPQPGGASRKGAVSKRTHGDIPSPADPPSGCRFRTRCPRADRLCAEEEPLFRRWGAGHRAACHHPLDGGCGETVIAGRSA